LRATKSAPAACCFALVVRSNAGNGLHFAMFANHNDIGRSFGSSQINIINFLNGENMTHKFLNFWAKQKIILNLEDVWFDRSVLIGGNDSVRNLFKKWEEFRFANSDADIPLRCLLLKSTRSMGNWNLCSLTSGLPFILAFIFVEYRINFAMRMWTQRLQQWILWFAALIAWDWPLFQALLEIFTIFIPFRANVETVTVFNGFSRRSSQKSAKFVVCDVYCGRLAVSHSLIPLTKVASFDEFTPAVNLNRISSSRSRISLKDGCSR
jgi:hypothetical protein